MGFQDPTFVTFTTRGRNFTAILEPDLEDGGYVVRCKEISAAISQGDTIDEAIENIADAVELCLDYHDESASPKAVAL
jgi:predicted RNase H-like HicB family nuclease